MKTARFMLEDLGVMLSAIEQARTVFIQTVESKFQEACKARPPRDAETAKKMYSDALLSTEGFEAFQRLINLYSCVGGQAGEYLHALNTFNVVPIRPGLQAAKDEEAA